MSDFKIVKLLGNPVVIEFSGGINPQGDYNGATSYVLGDSVSYNGSSYVAIQATTGNLPTNTTYWQLLAQKGDVGPQGSSFQEHFETVSKNLKSWNATLNYTSGALTSIVYTDGTDTITKTLNYTGGVLTSIVLSGDTPGGISLTKTFTYTGDNLTGVAYS
jgi:hypothetical protein